MPLLEYLSYGPMRAKEWLAEFKRAPISSYEVVESSTVTYGPTVLVSMTRNLPFLEDRYIKIYVVVCLVTAVYPKFINPTVLPTTSTGKPALVPTSSMIIGATCTAGEPSSKRTWC